MNQVAQTDQQTDIINMDATQIAAKINNGEITSSEAVKTYTGHITQVNPRINAMVETRFDKAAKEAEEIDHKREISSSPEKLYGVPISVKESFAVKGMKTTSGILHRKDAVSGKDAEVIKQLKREGAIILGKTNTPEMCFCQETDNKLYGRTNNPWDLQRTAGGSSGGEGSLLAVGGATVGIGADIGGSIRFPSHFNGVVGFKSGKDQVSAEGNFPPFDMPLQQRMLGIGPMGKSVNDIRLLYNIIAKNPPVSRDTEGVQIDILPDNTGYPLSPKTAEILDNVIRFLGSQFPVTRTVPPFFNDSAQIWQEIMSVDGGSSTAKIAAPQSKSMFREFTKEKITKNAAVHSYLSWALIGTKMFQPNKKRIIEIESFLRRGDAILNDYLSKRLLIFPVYHRGAPHHGKVYKDIFSVRKTFKRFMPYVAYANVWGLPALTIPVDIDEHGMPLSVQIMCQNDEEDLLFQVGNMLESHFRGYQRCYVIDHHSNN